MSIKKKKAFQRQKIFSYWLSKNPSLILINIQNSNIFSSEYLDKYIYGTTTKSFTIYIVNISVL